MSATRTKRVHTPSPTPKPASPQAQRYSPAHTDSPPISYEQQVRVLLCLQRLLRSGETTSTYKYATLIALADLAIERPAQALPLDTIADKFIELYWQMSVAFPGKGTKGTGPRRAVTAAVQASSPCCANRRETPEPDLLRDVVESPQHANVWYRGDIRRQWVQAFVFVPGIESMRSDRRARLMSD